MLFDLSGLSIPERGTIEARAELVCDGPRACSVYEVIEWLKLLDSFHDAEWTLPPGTRAERKYAVRGAAAVLDTVGLGRQALNRGWLLRKAIGTQISERCRGEDFNSRNLRAVLRQPDAAERIAEAASRTAATLPSTYETAHRVTWVRRWLAAGMHSSTLDALELIDALTARHLPVTDQGGVRSMLVEDALRQAWTGRIG